MATDALVAMDAAGCPVDEVRADIAVRRRFEHALLKLVEHCAGAGVSDFSVDHVLA
jgi:hypothetical protein